MPLDQSFTPIAAPPRGAIDAELILAARRHFRMVHHVDGRIRLRFELSALAALLHGRAATLETALRRLRGIRSTEINLAACSLIVHYDPTTLPPADWELLLEGSPASAAALVARLLASS
ncbi:hypothetical protein HNR60_001879 [Rhodopseudomonas rhenobacensis]|uniref:Heavy-metal-associated domain-containing protein n=1 Tax=Rhodopseudomonas rhenobacensis TaxID=87461 RepID=A0A7W7Z3S5_9BRAD|nr:heavy-metal-associated domain-containing protein [Rhodopseudomonas rhenobacensis]MBB5047127.1 hypothetical protein [Rhodopseudomonas rhenobacensis]